MANDFETLLHIVNILTPFILGLGIWILNSVSRRIAAIEEACEQRHKHMWDVIRKIETDTARLSGRFNSRT